MIKQNAKRNNRQHKKLKSGAYTQWTWRYRIEGDFPDDQSLDDLYDLAEERKVWLALFEKKDCFTMLFYNESNLAGAIMFDKIDLKKWLGGINILEGSVSNKDVKYEINKSA